MLFMFVDIVCPLVAKAAEVGVEVDTNRRFQKWGMDVNQIETVTTFEGPYLLFANV